MSVGIVIEKVQNYAMLEDHVLVEMVHSGDEKSLEYLINKYQNLVRGKARKYF